MISRLRIVPPPRGLDHHFRLPSTPSPPAAFLLHPPTCLCPSAPPSSPRHIIFPSSRITLAAGIDGVPFRSAPSRFTLMGGSEDRINRNEDRVRYYACVQRDAARAPIVAARRVRATVGLVHGVLPSRRPPASIASSLTSRRRRIPSPVQIRPHPGPHPHLLPISESAQLPQGRDRKT
jgi:hypothetical protein